MEVRKHKPQQPTKKSIRTTIYGVVVILFLADLLWLLYWCAITKHQLTGNEALAHCLVIISLYDSISKKS
jgi:hypothetical protein